MSLDKDFDNWAKHKVENYCDAEFNGKYYVMRENSRLSREDKHFLILSLNFGLKAWQAATQVEGFKFVPVEPTKRMIDAGMDEHSYNECHSDVPDIYKAMIGEV